MGVGWRLCICFVNIKLSFSAKAEDLRTISQRGSYKGRLRALSAISTDRFILPEVLCLRIG